MITNHLWLWLLILPIAVGLILLFLIFRNIRPARPEASQPPEKPAGGLVGRVPHAVFFDGPNDRDGVIVALEITNRGEPTIAHRWGLILELGGAEFRYRATHPNPDFTVWDNEGHPVKLESSQMIYEKVGTTPIPKGGLVPGYLIFLTKGISHEQLKAAQPRPRLKVIFSDVFGNEYVAESSTESLNEILYQPGLNDPFAMLVIREALRAKSGRTTLEIIDDLIKEGEELAELLTGFDTEGSQKLHEPWIEKVQDLLRQRESQYLPMFNESHPYTKSIWPKKYPLVVDGVKWMEDKERRFSWETVMARLETLREIRKHIRSKLP